MRQHTSFLPHFSHFWHVINIFFAIALPIEHSASSAKCPKNFFKIANLHYLVLDNLLKDQGVREGSVYFHKVCDDSSRSPKSLFIDWNGTPSNPYRRASWKRALSLTTRLLLPLYSHFSNLFDYAYVIAVFNNHNTEFATPIKVFAYKDNVDVR